MRRSVEAWQAECAVPPVVRRGHQNADTWLGPYERAAPLSGHGQAFGLAVFAWRGATPPVMSPGYVRRHPRILSARLERADWDSSLTAHVDLVIPQPPSLSCRLTLDAM